jgi:hypothetical protein
LDVVEVEGGEPLSDDGVDELVGDLASVQEKPGEDRRVEQSDTSQPES